MARSSTAAQAAAHTLPPSALGVAQAFWLSARQLADAAQKAAELPPAALLQDVSPGAAPGRPAGAGGSNAPGEVAPGALVAELSALGRHIAGIRRRLTSHGQPINLGNAEAGKAPTLHQGPHGVDPAAAEAAMHRRLAQGELLPTADYVARRGISRQALSKALAAQRVFYVEVGGQRCVPAFFMDAQLERRQLEAVCKALGELPGPAKLQFFTTPKASLEGLTPLQALAQGLASRVRVAATGFAQR